MEMGETRYAPFRGRQRRAVAAESAAALVALFEDGFAPPSKGNEDMLFVRALGGTSARLAPKQISRRFAVEETYDVSATPVGVYHLMRTMPHANRTRLLDACPEASYCSPPCTTRAARWPARGTRSCWNRAAPRLDRAVRGRRRGRRLRARVLTFLQIVTAGGGEGKSSP